MASTVRCLRRLTVGLLAVLATAASAGAVAPIITQTDFGVVRVDGVRLGTLTGSSRGVTPAIYFDPGTQLFHLWYSVVQDSDSDCTPQPLTAYRHATGTDGFNFTTLGALSYASDPFSVGTPWGMAKPGGPALVFPFVANPDGNFRLFFWSCHRNPAPSLGDYDYGPHVNVIGANLNNLVLNHLGPVGPIPANQLRGFTIGCWGLVDGQLYCENNLRSGGMGRLPYTDGPPVVPPAAANTGPWAANAIPITRLKDLVTPIPGFSSFDSGEGETVAYVHNHARVIKNGDQPNTMGVLYGIRRFSDGTRPVRQVYYAESPDGGATWADPAGIFPDGNLVTIEGLPPTNGFSPAEFVPMPNGDRFVYFNTQDAEGRWIVAGVLHRLPPSVIEIPTLQPAGFALLALLLVASGIFLQRRRAAARGR